MNCSVMKMVYYERGLLWTWSVINVVCNELVCYEHGLFWTWSVMNWSVMNVIYYGLVCCERGLLLVGLLWTGLLWTWSVLNGLFWAVCYEQVCFERSPKISTENTEELCLPTDPRQCMLQVTGNTLQQVENFKHLGVVFASNGRRSEEID